MTSDQLRALIMVAQAEHPNEPDDAVVLLPHGVFFDLRSELVRTDTMYAYNVTHHTFKYMGATVSWTPALDEHPRGHIVGKLWRGAK